MTNKSQGQFQGQRVAVLVDGQNIYLSAKSHGAKPDYMALLKLIEGRQVIRALIYNILPEGVDQSKFVNAVESMGYEMRTKKPRRLPDGSLKADWDMQMAIDALALADKVDVMVIISGDADFIPLIHALRSKGVKAEIISFRCDTSKELVDAADSYTDITDNMLYV